MSLVSLFEVTVGWTSFVTVCLCVCLFHKNLWYGAVWRLWQVTVDFPFLLNDSCFAHSDASVPTPDALLILEVRVILIWSSFNWQIEWISLTTSLRHSSVSDSVGGTCLSFAWAAGQIWLSDSFSLSHTDTLTQTVSLFLYLSSSFSFSFSCAFLGL